MGGVEQEETVNALGNQAGLDSIRAQSHADYVIVIMLMLMVAMVAVVTVKMVGVMMVTMMVIVRWGC